MQPLLAEELLPFQLAKRLLFALKVATPAALHGFAAPVVEGFVLDVEFVGGGELDRRELVSDGTQNAFLEPQSFRFVSRIV